MNGLEWLRAQRRRMGREPLSPNTTVGPIERPTVSPEFLRRKDKRGQIRYVERPDGTRMRMTARGDGSMVSLEPGTPEFTKRYIPPGEKVIEQFQGVGPEGYRFRKLDGVTGEPLED